MPPRYRTAHGFRQLKRAIELLDRDLTVAERCQILRVNARQQRRLMAEAKKIVARRMNGAQALERAVFLAKLCAQIIPRLPCKERVCLGRVFDQLQLLLGEADEPESLQCDAPDPLVGTSLLEDEILMELETFL